MTITEVLIRPIPFIKVSKLAAHRLISSWFLDFFFDFFDLLFLSIKQGDSVLNKSVSLRLRQWRD